MLCYVGWGGVGGGGLRKAEKRILCEFPKKRGGGVGGGGGGGGGGFGFVKTRRKFMKTVCGLDEAVGPDVLVWPSSRGNPQTPIEKTFKDEFL